MNENNNKNASQNQGQRTPQSDVNKPQKQGGGIGDKPGQRNVSSGNVSGGGQDLNKTGNKNQGMGQGQKDNPDVNPGMGGVGGKQTSSNADKLDNDIDEDRATQRTQRPNADRDQQK